jgi:hypothetical protein
VSISQDTPDKIWAAFASGTASPLSHKTLFNFDFTFKLRSGSNDGRIFGTAGATGPGGGTCFNDMLMYRCAGTDSHSFVGTQACDTNVNSDGIHHDIFIVGDGRQTIDGSAVDSEPCFFFGASRAVIAGVDFGGDCERPFRFSKVQDNRAGTFGPVIVAHNSFPETNESFRTPEATLALRGSPGHPFPSAGCLASGDPDPCCTGVGAGATCDGGVRHALLSDNLWPLNTYSHTQISLASSFGSTGPLTVPHYMAGADILIERNRGLGYNRDNQTWIYNAIGRRVTVRNNIVETTGAGQIYESLSAPANPPTSPYKWQRDNVVVHNTVRGYGSDIPFEFQSSQEEAGTCRNNVYYNAGNTGRSCTGGGISTEQDNASRSPSDTVQLMVGPYSAENPHIFTSDGTNNYDWASQVRTHVWHLNSINTGGTLATNAGDLLRGSIFDYWGVQRDPDGDGKVELGALEDPGTPDCPVCNEDNRNPGPWGHRR